MPRSGIKKKYEHKGKYEISHWYQLKAYIHTHQGLQHENTVDHAMMLTPPTRNTCRTRIYNDLRQTTKA